MSNTLADLIQYRIDRAYETLADARLLADNNSWNSCINRLYYASFYVVNALLLKNNIRTHTHNGCKTKFHSEFIKTGLVDKNIGKLYSELFDNRQEGDYADFIFFNREMALPLIEGTENLVKEIEKLLK
jgi:hypothetical protein